MIKQAFADALATAMNAYLNLDPDCVKKLAKLDGKVIQIEIREIGASFFIAPHAKGLNILTDYPDAPDSCIKASALTFMRFGLLNPDPATISKEFDISGNVQLGRKMSQILQQIDIDWEDHFSRIIGDIPAHQLANCARAIRGWSQQAGNSLKKNITEFLQEESRQLPPKEEVQDFMADVSTLRDATERLAAKIKLLIEKTP